MFVIGGGNSAAEEALFLTRFAHKVTIIVRKDHLRAQALVQQELTKNDKIEVKLLTSIVKVDGQDLISEIHFRNNKTGEISVEHVEEGSVGIFVLVGREPETELLDGLVEKDSAGYVITDPHMATSAEGIFAAGDTRDTVLRQIITAAADGAIAATSAAAYLGQPIDS